MARKRTSIFPRTVEETSSFKVVQVDRSDFDVSVGGRYVGSRNNAADALALARHEAYLEAEAAGQEPQDDAAALAAYTAEHAAYEIAYNADSGDYDVIYGKGKPWEVWLGSAPTYADGDAVIDAHIARMQAAEA